MAETISLFGIEVYGYGFFAAAGMICLLAAMALLGRGRVKAGTIPLLGLSSAVFGLICARLVFCLINLRQYTDIFENVLLMVRFWDGGFSMTGLLAGILLAVLLTARATGARFAQIADLAFAPMGLLIAALRFGEKYTDIGIGKVLEGDTVSPILSWMVQEQKRGKNTILRIDCRSVEMIVALILAVAVIAVYLRISSKPARMGDSALLFFVLFGATQTVLESLHDDRHMVFIVYVRFGQIGAAASMLISAVLLAKRWKKAGGSSAAVKLTIAAGILLLGILAVLEFSLDGRLTFGKPSMLRDYAIMCLSCFAMAVGCCTLMAKRPEAC